MTFERLWALAFLVLPFAWAYFEYRRTQRLTALWLKVLGIAAIIVALAEPVIVYPQTKVALAVLVDTSSSVTESDLAHESDLANNLQKRRSRNWVRVFPFARSIRSLSPAEQKNGLHLEYASGAAGQGTDLEAAVREAVASLPSGLIPRLVLVSDGKENSGSVTRAVWQAQRLGIPIDTVPLEGRHAPTLNLESVSVPTVAFTGEKFPIDIDVTSPRAARGVVEIRAEGKSLGSSAVSLAQGDNQIRVQASLSEPGVLNLSGAIQAGDLGDLRFNRAVTLRRPKVLYVSQDPAGSETHLLQALSAAQFDVRQSSDPLQGRFTDYQIVVLNNIDLEALPASRKDEAEKFVKQGGGLLVIGGERNVYDENKKTADALDRTLPAKIAPPRSPEGTAVVIIIDKSSSMEGRKIELARLAASGVVENLRPIDQVGVLMFDNSFQWAVPLRRAEDKVMIRRLIAGIIPDGGTQIAPALAEAYRKILPARATFKHIVLLTDGISEEGDSFDLSKQAAAQHVTISTVGLGQDVNRLYLERIATLAEGKAYFLNEPAGLEQILLKDVMEHTGTTAVEKPLTPVVVKQTEVLQNVGIESAPPLKGYIRYIANPGADTILKIDDDQPLLTRWQYGLGRATVFTSDAKSRWAADWVAWKGFDKLWTNLFHDLLPHAELGEAKTEFDSASGDILVDYRLGDNVNAPGALPPIFVLGPDGFQRPLPVTKLADQTYRGRIHIGQLQGLFRIRPVEESRAFPEVGYYRQEQELLDYGSNAFLLKSIAQYTGGRFNPAPSQFFDAAGRSEPATLHLWPAFLCIAILLNLAELVLRKGRAAAGAIFAKFATPATPA